jgi:Zn-dependent protease
MSNTAVSSSAVPDWYCDCQTVRCISASSIDGYCRIAASCAFATPVGTPPNTLVLGPGGYKFMDYVKAGTGLVIVMLHRFHHHHPDGMAFLPWQIIVKSAGCPLIGVQSALPQSCSCKKRLAVRLSRLKVSGSAAWKRLNRLCALAV